MPSVFLTPQVVDYEPPYNQNQDGLIFPNPLAGEPRPLMRVGVPVQLPAVSDAPSHARYVIEKADVLPEGEWGRIIPGTRIVEVAHPGLEHVLVHEAGYIHCDPPNKRVARQKKEQTS